MNLLEYVNILLRRGWIMLLLALLAALGAWWLGGQQMPVFRATQRVLMQPTRADFGLTEASKTLLGNHVAYLDSEFRAAEIIENLRLDMTAEYLLGQATIAADPLNLTIQIDVDLADGELANDVAREWGNLLIQYRNDENQRARREDHVNARLQDNARYSLLRPRPALNAAAGAILGLIVGGVVVLVLEYLESSIVRNSEDMERATGISVLANIPQAEG